MRSNIPKRTCRSTPCRISPPNRLFLPRRLHCRGQPVLCVLHLHHACPPQLSRCDHLSRLPHHGVARVIVRQAKDQPALPHDLRKRQRIFHRRGQRLVANNVNPCLQERFSRPKMHVIRCHDRHRVNAVRPLRFRCCHFRKTAVCPVRREV